MQCKVQGCPNPIAPERVQRVGAKKVKTCSTACSARYQKQTNAQRTRDYWKRQNEADALRKAGLLERRSHG